MPNLMFCLCLGCVFGLGCFLGFLVGSWAWEQVFCMQLGSAWAMLGIPSSQVGLMFALCGIALWFGVCWVVVGFGRPFSTYLLVEKSLVVARFRRGFLKIKEQNISKKAKLGLIVTEFYSFRIWACGTPSIFRIASGCT